MTSLKHFSSAATGQVPVAGRVTEAVVMGKSATTAFEGLARHIGHGVEMGRIDPTQAAIEAHAAHAVKATPGGGLQATGDEDVRYKPSPDNDLLFTGRQGDVGGPKMNSP